jgi:hypothetical protein
MGDSYLGCRHRKVTSSGSGADTASKSRLMPHRSGADLLQKWLLAGFDDDRRGDGGIFLAEVINNDRMRPWG